MTTVPRVHLVETSTHGRYVVGQPDGAGPAPMLVGFHGYAEHAERHLGELDRIPGSERWLRVSVQALHRFYSASRNHVVGSWMTRQDRDQAIADNLAYVAAVLAQVTAEYEVRDPLVYAGFSQGVAMAYRAATRVAKKCHGVIVLGGDLPPELRHDPAIDWPPVLVGRGRTDEWYTDAKMDADLSFLTDAEAPVESLIFDGGHEWTDAFREAAGRFLEARQ